MLLSKDNIIAINSGSSVLSIVLLDFLLLAFTSIPNSVLMKVCVLGGVGGLEGGSAGGGGGEMK